ncbi:MAG: hypothetical protein LBJ02_12060 [Bifidobacteriaceae bacterium]|jgi:hypothetical protein|nr:hypothetical protein [Bifidobacteriaceae bacterium]
MNRQITLFLASSDELKKEREALGAFVNQLNDIYRAQHPHKVRVTKWEWESDAILERPKQDVYNDKARASDIALFLFATVLGKGTAAEFDAVAEAVAETGRPRVTAWFKQLAPGQTLEPALQQVRDQITGGMAHPDNAPDNHLCLTFASAEELKLGVLFQLQANELALPVIAEFDRATVNGQPVIDLTQIPAYTACLSAQRHYFLDATARLATTAPGLNSPAWHHYERGHPQETLRILAPDAVQGVPA